jgi:hypothetical protein
MALSVPSGPQAQVPPRRAEPRQATRFDASMERWSPARWTAELGPMLVDAIDDLQRRPAEHRNDRGFHRRGFVYRGRFRSTGLAERHSDFLPFRRGTESDAVVRLSAFDKEPASDRAPVRDVLGMAVKLLAPLGGDDSDAPGDPTSGEPVLAPGAGETSDFVAMTADVFPVRTSLQFHRLLRVLGRARTLDRVRGLLWLTVTLQASPAGMMRFARALQTRHADVFEPAYHGVQTFWLLEHPGRDDRPALEATAMRYRWLPLPGEGPVSEASPRSFLLELSLRSADTPHDELIDPSRRWRPAGARLIAGRLDLLEALPEDDRDLAFNPVVLAPGIEPSDDDLFAGRRGAYAVSHLRRSPHVARRLREP